MVHAEAHLPHNAKRGCLKEVSFFIKGELNSVVSMCKYAGWDAM